MNLNFTNLPDLVIENILDYLNQSELLQLRLVSKFTKDWVDCPRYTKSRKCYIESEEKLNEIMKNSPSFQIYNVVVNTADLWWDDSFVSFLQKYDSLVELKLVEIDILDYPNDLINILLNVTPKLKSLCVSYCRPVDFSDNIRKMINFQRELLKYDEELKANLSGLNKFCIENNNGARCSNMQDLYEKFFSFCPNLNFIRCPLLERHLEALWHTAEDTECQPLLTYLRNRFDNKQHSNSRVQIDFGYINIRDDWENGWTLIQGERQNPSIFPLSPTGLVKLSKYGKKLKLINVPSHSLPNTNAISQADKMCLDECIESVACVNLSAFVPDSEKYLPKYAKIKLAIGLAHNAQEMCRIPHLNISSITLDWLRVSIRFPRFFPAELKQDLYQNLFETVRPSVTELNLKGVNGCIYKDSTRFSTCFPNLKKLYVREHGWQSHDEVETNTQQPPMVMVPTDWFSKNGLCFGLNELEEVHLVGCYLMAKEMRDYEDHLRHFKKLRRPVLTGCYEV